MRGKVVLGWVILVVAAATLIFGGCGSQDYAPVQEPEKPVSVQEELTPVPIQETVTPVAVKPEVYRTQINFVGDLMVHNTIAQAAYIPAAASYDFTGMFEAVAPYLQEGYTIGNLETPVAGDHLGFPGYPRFNAPVALLSALQSAGFDMLLTANNHSLDQGQAGLLATLQNLAIFNLAAQGTFAAPEEAWKVKVYELNGIRVAFLTYTYGTNGIPIPRGHEYLINLIEPVKMKSDIQQARESGVDFVIVMLHFGKEYHQQPAAEQRELVAQLRQWGASLVVGSHPHVVQPVEGDHNFLVAYSLGNFLADQRRAGTDRGAILQVILEKNITIGENRIVKATFYPTRIQRGLQQQGARRFRIEVMHDSAKQVVPVTAIR